MKPCIACGYIHPVTRIVDPGSPNRVAIVDATALARLIGHGYGTFNPDRLVDLLAESPRFVRCARCGALSRLGEVDATWLPGPTEPPRSGARRVVVVPARRQAFDELWRGERTYVFAEPEQELVVGDSVRVIETFPEEQRDPIESPRFVLGIATSRAEVGDVDIVSLRVTTRGVEDRSAETRRARMIAALEETGSHVATAALVLGISVGEAYRWVHELGLESRIKAYRPRTRTKAVGGT